MNDGDWNTAWAKSLTMFLAGKGLDTTDEKGSPVEDDDLLLWVHGGHEPLDFTMPTVGTGAGPGELLLDTTNDDAKGLRSLNPGESASGRRWSVPSRLYRRSV